jgi:hypothetical protein
VSLAGNPQALRPATGWSCIFRAVDKPGRKRQTGFPAPDRSFKLGERLPQID